MQGQTAPPRKQRLTTAQTLQLMRFEVDNAARHGHPLSCMIVGLDGFWEPELVLHRRTVMPQVFQELKAVTFEGDVRGLGIWSEAFQLAVFPHVEPENVVKLAESLRARARALTPADVPPSVKVTLSIGVAHNLRAGEVTFEALVEECEAGMALSQGAGGDRVTLAREVENQLDHLKEELDGQIAEIKKVQAKVFGDNPGEDERLWGQNLIEKVIDVFSKETEQSEGVLRLQRSVVALLTEEVSSLSQVSSVSQLLESQRQIENLERRITKLTESLGMTEAELKRIAAMKNIDLGVASIYRSVQGLADDDANAEAKREMLKNIFEANVALREALVTKTE